MTEEVVGVYIDIMEHDRGSSRCVYMTLYTSWNMREEVVGVSIDIMEHDRGSSRCVYRHHGT